MDVLVKNGLLVTAEKEFKADILMSSGLIAMIGHDISAPPDTEVVDADGMLVIPGGVDAHTHVDLSVGPAHVSDGWFGGSRAAAHGGTTTIIEHPGFGPQNCPLDYQLKQYRNNAVKSAIDYGLHGVFQHWSRDVKLSLPGLVAEGCPSFKTYMTYDGRLNDEDFLSVLEALGQAGGLMTVHAENHAVLAHLGRELKTKAPHNPLSHAESRPDYAEALAVETAIALAEAAGGVPLYIVHLSTAKGLAAVRRARAEGKRVWAETCPQYLVLTEDRYRAGFDQALKYVMAPALRKKSDVEALWEGLADGSVSTVATDHCSFSWKEKKARAKGDVFQCPGGAPGIETRLTLLYSEGVLKRGLSLSRWVELVSTAPADLFGLAKKGRLEIGRDADIVIFDPAEKKEIKASTLHQDVDYTPFENIVTQGWPKTVFLRGRKIIDGERFMGEPGQGLFIARQPFSG